MQPSSINHPLGEKWEKNQRLYALSTTKCALGYNLKYWNTGRSDRKELNHQKYANAFNSVVGTNLSCQMKTKLFLMNLPYNCCECHNLRNQKLMVLGKRDFFGIATIILLRGLGKFGKVTFACLWWNGHFMNTMNFSSIFECFTYLGLIMSELQLVSYN